MWHFFDTYNVRDYGGKPFLKIEFLSSLLVLRVQQAIIIFMARRNVRRCSCCHATTSASAGRQNSVETTTALNVDMQLGI